MDRNQPRAQAKQLPPAPEEEEEEARREAQKKKDSLAQQRGGSEVFATNERTGTEEGKGKGAVGVEEEEGKIAEFVARGGGGRDGGGSGSGAVGVAVAEVVEEGFGSDIYATDQGDEGVGETSARENLTGDGQLEARQESDAGIDRDDDQVATARLAALNDLRRAGSIVLAQRQRSSTISPFGSLAGLERLQDADLDPTMPQNRLNSLVAPTDDTTLLAEAEQQQPWDIYDAALTAATNNLENTEAARNVA